MNKFKGFWKKQTMFVIAALLSCSIFSNVANAYSVVPVEMIQPEVILNGKKLSFPDVHPVIDDSQHVLVPIRVVSEHLGAKVGFSGKTITIRKGSQTIMLSIGQSSAMVNGQKMNLDSKAIVKAGRMLVPFRFISEALGQQVKWDSATRFVWIGSQDIPELKDVVKPVSLTPYMSYFKDGEFILSIIDTLHGNTPITATTAFMIDENVLPIRINGVTYYRYDLVHDKEGTVYIRSVDEGIESMATQLYYIGQNSKLRYRNSIQTDYPKDAGDVRVHYYRVVQSNDEDDIGDHNYKQYTIGKADYIGINASYSGLILMTNPFK